MITGKALAFYAKYTHEIDAIYDTDEEVSYKTFVPETSDTDNDHIPQMIESVYVQSEKEIKEFLSSCIDVIEKTFSEIKIGKCRRIKTRNAWKASTSIKDFVGNKDIELIRAGLYTYTGESCLMIAPYLWVRGGRPIEEELVTLISNEAIEGKKGGWGPGIVFWESVPIIPDNDLTINEEQLRINVTNHLISITTKQLRKIHVLSKKYAG